MANDQLETSVRQVLSYSAGTASSDGVFVPLLADLARIMGTSDFVLSRLPGVKGYMLWLRQNDERVFYIMVTRKHGRHMVKMGGTDPRRVQTAIQVCREHFDRWFGVNADDLDSGNRHCSAALLHQVEDH